MELAQFFLKNSSTFLFVLTRAGAILFTAPIFGAFNVPMRVRFALTLLVALILVPLTPFVPMPESLVALVLSVGGEVLIGVAIGLVIKFFFTGVEFAGQIASFQMGIGMSSAYDPLNAAQVTILGRMMSILSLLIFLSLNGHLMVIMALKRSFDVIPPYGFTLSPNLMESFVVFSREIFILAVKFAAPVIAILLFVNLSMGIMARSVPQLNMFVIGFAVTILAGFVVLALSLPVLETSLVSMFERMWSGVFSMMKVMSHA
ncbi:MAG: flagellar biosynthetic protein FliR [Thermodesulfobacteriota bacterium]